MRRPPPHPPLLPLSLLLLFGSSRVSGDDVACAGTPNTHPVWTDAPRPDPSAVISTVPNGQRLVAGPPDLSPPITVLNVSGTAFQMGEAQGKLMAAELAVFLPQVLDYLSKGVKESDLPPQFRDAFATGGIPGCLDLVFNLTLPFIAPRFLDEIRGLSVGSGLAEVTFRRVAMMGELTKMGCSMIGAWGPATAAGSAAGGLLQLRALDWDTDGPFQAYPVVLVRHPSDGGHPFVTVGYAGDVGAITGYSSADVAISEKVWLHYAGGSTFAGAPTVFVLRDILQFSTDLGSAIAEIEDSPRTNSIFAGVGAKKDGQFRIVEYAHDNITVWSDSTGPNYGNHTRRTGLVYIDKHTQPDDAPRAWCLDNLLHQHYGQLDASLIIHDVAARFQTGDSHIAIYDFGNRHMFVAYPSVSGFPGPPQPVVKAYDRPYTRFDLAALLPPPAH